MPHQVLTTVKRDALAPCITCPLCHKLFRDATTIIECLHTFCRKCIYKKLSDEEMECCPICNIDLGCVPMEKLRPDHNLQDVRSKIFPSKRIKAKAPEIIAPVTLPAKRKERSLSALVVSTPRVSAQAGMTGRRSKSIVRKVSKGSFTIEKHVKREEGSTDDQCESSSSPEMAIKSSQSLRQSREPCNNPGTDMWPENGSHPWEPKVDLWKPLNCLVEAANRSKSSKFSFQGSGSKPEGLHSPETKAVVSKAKSKEHKSKSKAHDEKNHSDGALPDSGRPKKLCKVRQKNPRKFGDFQFHPQVLLDASSSKLDRRNYPIWFSLVSEMQAAGTPPLPQLSSRYLRIKDGSMPVSFIQKYVRTKLDLSCEDEVEIKCRGQAVVPTLTLNNVLDLWLRATETVRVSAGIGSSGKDFVMVLGYSRRAPSCQA